MQVILAREIYAENSHFPRTKFLLKFLPCDEAPLKKL